MAYHSKLVPVVEVRTTPPPPKNPGYGPECLTETRYSDVLQVVSQLIQNIVMQSVIHVSTLTNLSLQTSQEGSQYCSVDINASFIHTEHSYLHYTQGHKN